MDIPLVTMILPKLKREDLNNLSYIFPFINLDSISERLFYSIYGIKLRKGENYRLLTELHLNYIFVQLIKHRYNRQVVSLWNKGYQPVFSLQVSCHYGNLAIVKFLIIEGVDVNAYFGVALRTAVRNRHLEVVKCLLMAKANLHIKNDGPLRDAVIAGDIDIVKLLIKRGANVNVQEGFPLQCAAYQGYLNIVIALVENGANIYTQNDLAIRNAALRGHLTIVKYLLAKRQKSNRKILQYIKEINLPLYSNLVAEV